jgi:hypothetical protein
MGESKKTNSRGRLQIYGQLLSSRADKRRYPVQEFKAFVQGVRRYIQITAGDPMIHKSVAGAVRGGA